MSEEVYQMPDREKVIRGLVSCSFGDCTAIGCPYARQAGCMDLVFQDAITLLKEQETKYTPDGPDFIDGRMFIRWKCTSCQYFVCTEKGTPDMKYCPKCGRKVARP